MHTLYNLNHETCLLCIPSKLLVFICDSRSNLEKYVLLNKKTTPDSLQTTFHMSGTYLFGPAMCFLLSELKNV